MQRASQEVSRQEHYSRAILHCVLFSLLWESKEAWTLHSLWRETGLLVKVWITQMRCRGTVSRAESEKTHSTEHLHLVWPTSYLQLFLQTSLCSTCLFSEVLKFEVMSFKLDCKFGDSIAQKRCYNHYMLPPKRRSWWGGTTAKTNIKIHRFAKLAILCCVLPPMVFFSVREKS